VYDGDQLLRAKRQLEAELQAKEKGKHCRGCNKAYRSQKKWSSCDCGEFRLCADCAPDEDLFAQLLAHTRLKAEQVALSLF
jgi:hypothetical protein